MAKGLQRRRGSTDSGPRIGVRHGVFCVIIVSISTVGWFQFHFSRSLFGDAEISGAPLSQRQDTKRTDAMTVNADRERDIPWECTFREYPPRRYYHLNEKIPFLEDSEYIYGRPPTLLEGTKDLMPYEGKICIDQTIDKDMIRPFSDGTNPSILGLHRLPSTHVLNQGLAQQKQFALFLGSTCITDGQCSWKDTEEEKLKYQISPSQKQTAKYTKLLLLDSKLHTLQETTLMLELDAPWGRRSRQARRDPKAKNGFVREAKAFDDARLFLHKSQVWVSYREGPGFGYEQQVLNPIHFEISSDNSVMEAHVKASETTSFCCGRNMALVSDGEPNTALQSLTWVDPVTMVNVDDGTNKMPTEKRRRQLRERKSDFHGTNGFLIPLETTNEYLGIGHFHRPPGRDTSDYARHGHHYTHAFFTITAKPPHRLTRLSHEFVFETKSKAFVGKNVTDMIQFASGAELVGDDTKGKLLVVYGINDCEGASIFIDMSVVQSILVPVQEGAQVVDVMKKLT